MRCSRLSPSLASVFASSRRCGPRGSTRTPRVRGARLSSSIGCGASRDSPTCCGGSGAIAASSSTSSASASPSPCNGCAPPGSDLQGSAWLRTVESPGFSSIELQHLYRTVGFLAEVREPLEKDLFARDRDLFSQTLDLVFIDITSSYLYGSEETELRKRGYSRDRMPDQPQVILCLAVDRHGWPIAWDILPGNTADRPAFVAMIKKLRERFRIGRAVVVADRGMISKDTIALLADHAQAPFDFILGCRMRQQKEVSEEVLARAGRYKKVAEQLEVKEVVVEGRRYVVCRNPAEAKKDAAAREAIIAKLETALAQSPKSVLGNKGFARFLHLDKSAVTIDRQAIERDARLDGKFVLRTSTDLET